MKSRETVNVLIIGSGGREHTLIWKISQSPRAGKIYCIKGNAGICKEAQCIDLDTSDFEKLASFAKEKNIGLTIVGPEAPLVDGIVDYFRRKKLNIFGPDKHASRLEGSKVFAKTFMKKHSIATADFEVFDDPKEALEYINKSEQGKNIVIKADGLAAGKGVIIAKSHKEAREAVERIMIEKQFGEAGDRIIIEECLEGEEASVLLLIDGHSIKPLISSQDHKRIFDADKGPNTGGMGAYAPAPVVTEEMYEKISKFIILPLLDGFGNDNIEYKGILYLGLMIVDSMPYVLEFNVRFGDPETQVILPLLKSDLLEIMLAVSEGRLYETQLEWHDKTAVCVVLASEGYPGKYKRGEIITGLDKAEGIDDVMVFHAGTKQSSGSDIITSGGRVLGVTGLGNDLKDAIQKTYSAVDIIKFKGVQYRTDIGAKGL